MKRLMILEKKDYIVCWEAENRDRIARIPLFSFQCSFKIRVDCWIILCGSCGVKGDALIENQNTQVITQSIEQYYSQAEEYENDENYTAAIALYELILQLAPGHYQSLRSIALIRYNILHLYDEKTGEYFVRALGCKEGDSFCCGELKDWYIFFLYGELLQKYLFNHAKAQLIYCTAILLHQELLEENKLSSSAIRLYTNIGLLLESSYNDDDAAKMYYSIAIEIYQVLRSSSYFLLIGSLSGLPNGLGDLETRRAYALACFHMSQISFREALVKSSELRIEFDYTLTNEEICHYQLLKLKEALDKLTESRNINYDEAYRYDRMKAEYQTAINYIQTNQAPVTPAISFAIRQLCHDIPIESQDCTWRSYLCIPWTTLTFLYNHPFTVTTILTLYSIIYEYIDEIVDWIYFYTLVGDLYSILALTIL